MTDLAFIDTSGEQHPNGAPIDWHAVKASGVGGVYVKLSEGGVLDPHGQQDVRDARAAGLHAGVYHFARPDLNSAAAEAAAFNRFRAGLPTDCPPVLDTETGPITRQWNDEFDTLVPDDLGYTYRAALGTLDIPDSRIWAAVPGATSRTVSVYGLARTFVGVQYGTGTVPGIQTPTDLDLFDSSLIATPVPHGGVVGTMLAPRNDGSGIVDAFIVDADTKALATFQCLPDGTTTAPSDVNASPISRPLGACWVAASLLVLVKGTDNAVYTIRFVGGSWGGYTNVGNGAGAPVYTA